VFSIDGVGIVKASNVAHRINVAAITAKSNASNHSLIGPFFIGANLYICLIEKNLFLKIKV